MKRCPRLAAVVVLCGVLTLGGCTRTAESARPVTAGPESQQYGTALAKRIGTEAMMTHLRKLQDIADANGNTRVIGTPGFASSMDYVVNALRSKGFDVSTPEFPVRVFHAEPGTVVAGADTFTARALRYTVGTPAAGVTAALVAAPVEETPGCVAADYDGLATDGAVVLVDRGSCSFQDKMVAAAARGAVAMIVADNVEEEEMGGTLGEKSEVQIPVVSVTKADGAALRSRTGPVTVTLEASVEDLVARNVIAQTKTGSTADVVMVGAHLDSVAEGPGINDNGSGVAAVLETALQLGPSPPVRNAVRFAFWGAEEFGLIGSQRYVESLDLDQLRDIALYLNFDMIGSPNPGYFTYDGDQSAPRAHDDTPPWVPEGSPGIERVLVGYLKAAGKTAQDTAFDGRSDYSGFTLAGIPSGGLFSGAEEDMNEEQAKLWNGRAHEPFDPNYHKSTDTIDHINATALGIQGAGVGYAVGYFAVSVSGENSMPPRQIRTRHVVTPP